MVFYSLIVAVMLPVFVMICCTFQPTFFGRIINLCIMIYTSSSNCCYNQCYFELYSICVVFVLARISINYTPCLLISLVNIWIHIFVIYMSWFRVSELESLLWEKIPLITRWSEYEHMVLLDEYAFISYYNQEVIIGMSNFRLLSAGAPGMTGLWLSEMRGPCVHVLSTGEKKNIICPWLILWLLGNFGSK